MAEDFSGPERVAAVLFDLDGVLVDSAQVVERVWRRWAGEQQIPVEDVLAVSHGRPAREVVRMFAPHLDADRQALLIARHEARDSGGLAAVPGAHECVSLASRGPWAVVTSGGRRIAVGRLVAVGLPVPAVMVTADDVTCGKPDPEPYLRAAKDLDVLPGECIAIEDSPAGVTAAKRGGMTVLAVTTTHPASALQHADLVCPTLHGITQHLRAAGL
jgi:mannitol-1-/sugar-/sorbitol-6-phosphatase